MGVGSDPVKLFAERVRAERKRQGLTREDLARRCRLTRAQVFAIEQAKRASTLRTASKVAHGLGVPFAELVAPLGPQSDEGAVEQKRIAALQKLAQPARAAVLELVALLQAHRHPRRGPRSAK